MEKDGGWVTSVNTRDGEWEENALEQDWEEMIGFYLLLLKLWKAAQQS